MRRLNLYSLAFTILLIPFCFSAARAQGFVPPPADAENPPRPNLLLELNLTSDQIQQIKRLNQEKRPMMIEAQRRFREANRALDEAIYSDSEDEAEIQARMRAVQTAQAELFANRITIERAIRRILTPAQLIRFRELRNRFSRENNPASPFNNRRRQQENLRNLPKELRQKRIENSQKQRPNR